MSQWYSYTAVDLDGVSVRGDKLANSREEMLLWLQREQLLLLKLKTIRFRHNRLRNCLPGYRSAADLPTLEALSSGLSVLLGASVLVPEALQILISTGNSQVATVATRLHERLQSGQKLSIACEAEATVFGPLYPRLIEIGESTGDMATAFHRVLVSVRWHKKLQQRISQLLAYPLLMLVLMTGVLGFLLVHVVPQLRVFVDSVQQDFPWYTILLFNLSSLLVDHGQTVIAGTVVSLMLFGTGRSLLARTGFIDTLINRLWLVGVLVQQIRLARYFHALSIMCRSGLDYLTAFSHAQQSLGNRNLEHLAGTILVRIKQGSSPSAAMRDSGLFPERDWRMVKVAERTGDLSSIFEHIAAQYDEDLACRIERIEQYLPAVLVLAIGLVLMWIVVSILGPLYDTMIRSGAGIL